jgi:hypothetical protein
MDCQAMLAAFMRGTECKNFFGRPNRKDTVAVAAEVTRTSKRASRRISRIPPLEGGQDFEWETKRATVNRRPFSLRSSGALFAHACGSVVASHPQCDPRDNGVNERFSTSYPAQPVVPEESVIYA